MNTKEPERAPPERARSAKAQAEKDVEHEYFNNKPLIEQWSLQTEDLERELDAIVTKLNRLKSRDHTLPAIDAEGYYLQQKRKDHIRQKAISRRQRNVKILREKLLSEYEPVLQQEIEEISQLEHVKNCPATQAALVAALKKSIHRRIHLEIHRKMTIDWSLDKLMRQEAEALSLKNYSAKKQREFYQGHFGGAALPLPVQEDPSRLLAATISHTARTAPPQHPHVQTL